VDQFQSGGSIRNGTVRVTHEGAKIPPAFFGTGETVGDVLFIDGGPARVAALAVERVDLLVFRSAKVAEALGRPSRSRPSILSRDRPDPRTPLAPGGGHDLVLQRA